MRVLLIILALSLMSCAGAYKPEIGSGQSTSRVSFEAYLHGTLSLAGELKCGTLLGLTANQRKPTQLIHYDIGRDYDNKNNSVTILANKETVFSIYNTIPQSEGQQKYFYFKFTPQPNKTYLIKVGRVVVKKGIIFDDKKFTLEITDEQNQTVNYERLSAPNWDKSCESTSIYKEPDFYCC